MGEGMDAPAAHALPPSFPVCCSRASPVLSRFQTSGGSVGISVQEMSARPGAPAGLPSSLPTSKQVDYTYRHTNLHIIATLPLPVAARDFLHGARCAKSRGKTLGDVDGCVTFSLAARRILTRSPVHPPQSETVIGIRHQDDSMIVSGHQELVPPQVSTCQSSINPFAGYQPGIQVARTSAATGRPALLSSITTPQSKAVVVIIDEDDVGDGVSVSAPTSKKVGGLIDFNVAIM
jgi:hypothetical protein